jgi:hypothetical protein
MAAATASLTGASRLLAGNMKQSNKMDKRNKYLDYLRGPVGETWRQALERFALFCKNLRDFEDEGETHKAGFDKYYKDGTLFEKPEGALDSDLAEAGKKFGLTISGELADLLKNPFNIYDVSIEYGRFGERRVLAINRVFVLSGQIFSCIFPFCKAIDWNFGSRFADSELNEQQRKHLNDNYSGFGCWQVDDGAITYLLADRNGKYGYFKYEDGDFPENLKNLEPLLKSAALNMTLDELMVLMIDQSMRHLLDRNEIPDK